jgi:hypothetical protein
VDASWDVQLIAVPREPADLVGVVERLASTSN